jgi:hypothetical protein
VSDPRTAADGEGGSGEGSATATLRVEWRRAGASGSGGRNAPTPYSPLCADPAGVKPRPQTGSAQRVEEVVSEKPRGAPLQVYARRTTAPPAPAAAVAAAAAPNAVSLHPSPVTAGCWEAYTCQHIGATKRLLKSREGCPAKTGLPTSSLALHVCRRRRRRCRRRRRRQRHKTHASPPPLLTPRRSPPYPFDDDHGARRPCSLVVVARPRARDPASRPPSVGGAAAAGPQGSRLSRGGGARVRGGGGGDRAHAVCRACEEGRPWAPRVLPPTTVLEGSLLTRRS